MTFLLFCIAGTAHAATPMKHPWDTVKDVMAMHGKFDTKSLTWRSELHTGLQFAADNYRLMPPPPPRIHRSGPLAPLPPLLLLQRKFGRTPT